MFHLAYAIHTPISTYSWTQAYPKCNAIDSSHTHTHTHMHRAVWCNSFVFFLSHCPRNGMNVQCAIRTWDEKRSDCAPNISHAHITYYNTIKELLQNDTNNCHPYDNKHTGDIMLCVLCVCSKANENTRRISSQSHPGKHERAKGATYHGIHHYSIRNYGALCVNH